MFVNKVLIRKVESCKLEQSFLRKEIDREIQGKKKMYGWELVIVEFIKEIGG